MCAISWMHRDELRALAKKFRREATPAEQRAWEMLRAKRCLGLKFKRQFPIRGFIVDFFCRKLSLAIELDGAVHDDPDRKAYDAARDEMLGACGIKVVRLRNADVSQKLLEDLVRSHHSVPPPLV